MADDHLMVFIASVCVLVVFPSVVWHFWTTTGYSYFTLFLFLDTAASDNEKKRNLSELVIKAINSEMQFDLISKLKHFSPKRLLFAPY